MKLFLLIILFCGINVIPGHSAKAKKTHIPAPREASSFDIVPSGLLFQF